MDKQKFIIFWAEEKPIFISRQKPKQVIQKWFSGRRTGSATSSVLPGRSTLATVKGETKAIEFEGTVNEVLKKIEELKKTVLTKSISFTPVHKKEEVASGR